MVMMGANLGCSLLRGGGREPLLFALWSNWNRQLFPGGGSFKTILKKSFVFQLSFWVFFFSVFQYKTGRRTKSCRSAPLQ